MKCVVLWVVTVTVYHDPIDKNIFKWRITYFNSLTVVVRMFLISRSLYFILSLTAPAPWSISKEEILNGSVGGKPRLGMPTKNKIKKRILEN